MEYVSVVDALYLEFGHFNPSELHLCKYPYGAIENSRGYEQKNSKMEGYKRIIGFTNTNQYEDGQ